MNLGFIGTGKITSSVVTGICNSKIKFKKILISSRNRILAKKLERKFKKVKIVKNDTPQKLSKRILVEEHKLYPKAILKIFSL